MITKYKAVRYIVLALAVVITASVIALPIGIADLIVRADTPAEQNDAAQAEDGGGDIKDLTAEEIKAIINELEESIANVGESKNVYYEKIREVLEKKEEIESQYLIQKLEADAETQIIELRIDVYNDIIDKYDILISAKQSEIDQTREEFEAIYAAFSERLRQSHEEGLPSALEIFFNSESFIEMLTSIERMSDILEYDRRTMEELEKIENEKNDEMKALEELQAEQLAVVDKLAEEKKSLDEKLEASLAAIDIENSNIDEYLNLLQIAEQDEEIMNRRLNTAIDEYYLHLGEDEQKKYELTEEYKRHFVMPAIIERMENGEIMKGSEYFEDGEDFIWPLPMANYYRNVISSRFGYRTYTNSNGDKVSGSHWGYDLAVFKGTEIYACKTGTVVAAGYNSSYGYYIDLLHEDGSITRYGHCSKLLVSEGEFVLQGENIALVGSTGNSTGNHLHIEVRVNRSAQDPSHYIPMPTEKK